MKRQSVFLYASLAVGLSLLATLLLISRTAFASPESPEKGKYARGKGSGACDDEGCGKELPGTYVAATIAPLSAGGSDAFGYACIDSNEPDGPIYNFEDISTTGTSISLTRNQISGAIPVGFPFNYYGTDYTDVYVSSNGFLTVLPGQHDGCCSGDPVPSSDDPNGVIAGWWEDLYPPGGGAIHYQTLGSTLNRRFVIQFTDVPHCCGYPGLFPATFQYKLFEGTNEIEVHYQAAPSDGGRHSAGIENESGTVGLEYYHGSASLSTPLAVRYTLLPVVLSPSTTEGFELPGSTVVHTETLINRTGATDSFDIALFDNTWTSAISINSTGPISHGTSVNFAVEVDVPLGASPASCDRVTVAATSVNNPSVYSATATLTTTALSGQYGYVFNPDDDEIDVVDPVVHVDTGLAIDTSPYGSWPERGALSPDGRWLYASLRDSDRVLVIDAATHTPVITLPVGSDPHGIAFTADSATAFVANRWSDSASASGTVSVIDTGVPTVTTTIHVGDGPTSVASSPCLDKVYVTNADDGTVSVIDVETLTVTEVITGFSTPCDIVVSPYGHRAYVTNYWAWPGEISLWHRAHINDSPNTIGVIDTGSDSLVDTWVVGGEGLVVLDISPDGHTLYVADNGTDRTHAVDTSSGEVIATIPTGTAWEVEAFPLGAGPFAYTSNARRGQVAVVNVDTNSLVDTIMLGGGPRGLALFPPETACSHAVLLGPRTATEFGEEGTTVVLTETLHNVTGVPDSFDLALSGNAWPTTISTGNTGAIPDKGSIDFTVEVHIPPGADPGDSDGVTVAASSINSPTVYFATATLTTTALSGQYGYVFNPVDNEISVVDTVLHADTGLAIGTNPYDTIPYVGWPDSGAFSGALNPDGQWLYASLGNSARVLIIDTATHTPVITVPVGDGPHGIAFTADSAYAFVANAESGTVSVIDTGVPTVTATIPVGDEPYNVATSPCLAKVYVTNKDDDTVSVIDVGTLAVTKVITGFSGPWDVAVSPYGDRAYVSNRGDGTVGVIDTAGDSLVDTWAIGGAMLAGLDISPFGHTLYVADRWEYATYAVNASTGRVAATILTAGVWEVEAFPAGAGPFAYVSEVHGGQVAVVNVDTNQVVGEIPLGGGPRGLALFPPPTSCYTRTHLPLVMRNYP